MSGLDFPGFPLRFQYQPLIPGLCCLCSFILPRDLSLRQRNLGKPVDQEQARHLQHYWVAVAPGSAGSGVRSPPLAPPHAPPLSWVEQLLCSGWGDTTLHFLPPGWLLVLCWWLGMVLLSWAGSTFSYTPLGIPGHLAPPLLVVPPPTLVQSFSCWNISLCMRVSCLIYFLNSISSCSNGGHLNDRWRHGSTRKHFMWG